MNIMELDASHKGRRIVVRYKTAFYYKALSLCGDDLFGAVFLLVPFPVAQEKQYDFTLLDGSRERSRLFGVANETGEWIGYLETSHEWNDRFRIVNLWVDESYRRSGLGGKLMHKALDCAYEGGVRVMVLETETCNYPAIQFYRKFGFVFNGCDLTGHMSDDDIGCEVPLEMRLPLNQPSSEPNDERCLRSPHPQNSTQTRP